MEFLDLKLYQFVVVAISVAMIAFGLDKFIRRQPNQSLLKIAIRIIVWGGMIIVALFPRITNDLARFIGLEGNINAVILTGFILIFLLIFKMLAIIERIEQDISRLTRQDALDEFEKEQQKK